MCIIMHVYVCVSSVHVCIMYVHVHIYAVCRALCGVSMSSFVNRLISSLSRQVVYTCTLIVKYINVDNLSTGVKLRVTTLEVA